MRDSPGRSTSGKKESLRRKQVSVLKITSENSYYVNMLTRNNNVNLFSKVSYSEWLQINFYVEKVQKIKLKFYLEE